MKILVRDVNQFKEVVIKKGYSIRAFSRDLDVSAPYGNQLVNGERNPSPKVAKRICELLEVQFDDIFFIQDGCKSNQDDGCESNQDTA